MQPVTYTLEAFEGPLDLLLYLIEKHKLDIRDIPIAELLEQYLSAMESPGLIDPDNMSEFLLMASKLVYLKSRMLLPIEADEEDPREELAAMLADYLRYKELAKSFSERYDQFGKRLYARDQEKLDRSPPTLRPHQLSTLIDAYGAVFRGNLRRLPPPIESFSGIIVHKTISVAAKMFGLLRQLMNKKSLNIREAIYSQKSLSDAVAAFMAILDLAKQDRILLTGDDEGMELRLKREGQAVGTTH